MDNASAAQFLRAIYATQDTEIDCGTLLAVVDVVVDLTLTGQEDRVDPAVPQHLGQCAECRDLYESLLLVAHMESRGALPRAVDLLEELARGSALRPAAASQSAAPFVAVAAMPAAAVESAPPSGAAQPTPARAPTAPPRVGWRERFGSFPWAPVVAGAAAVVALALGVAWHEERQEADYLDYAMVVAMGADDMRTASLAGGGILKVMFDPSHKALLVAADDMPDGAAPLLMKCWLVDAAGHREAAGEYAADGAGRGWWMLRSNQDMSSYTEMLVTAGADDHQVAQLALR